jgi:putative membrane protein
MFMNNHSHDGNEWILQIIFALPFVLALVVYILATIISNRRYNKKWSLYRTIFWGLGILCASAAVIGPIADRAHMDFRAHMVSHLLLGMLAPLLLVLAAPMTLVLRTLPVNCARYISRILRSSTILVISNPVFATFINVGGLWLLYTTNLYIVMQQNILLHILVHIHVFIAGYLFTLSIIYIDPSPHRTSFIFRSIVLLIALAGHGVLSKYIYAHPPNSVSIEQSEMGGIIMYYGGDVIDLFLIFIFCFQWFKTTRPRVLSSQIQV